jgi:hypothetical protein
VDWDSFQTIRHAAATTKILSVDCGLFVALGRSILFDLSINWPIDLDRQDHDSLHCPPCPIQALSEALRKGEPLRDLEVNHHLPILHLIFRFLGQHWNLISAKPAPSPVRPEHRRSVLADRSRPNEMRYVALSGRRTVLITIGHTSKN